METTRCLREEHQLILRVLDCFEAALARSRESGRVTTEVFSPFAEFFRGYADRCHHCKEEDRLFPELERQGVPREGGPIGCMLQEHMLGRAHVKAIGDALEAADRGDQSAAQRVYREGDAYIDLLRNHIAKEDRVLFEMADQAVRGADLARLTAAYAEAEADPAYTGTFRRCRDIAERLIKTYAPSEA